MTHPQPGNPIERPRDQTIGRLVACMVALATTLALLPSGAIADEEYYVASYVGGATVFSSTLGCALPVCAVAGVILCEEGLVPIESGVGGSCAPRFIRPGQFVRVDVADGVASALSWAVCVDGDRNNLCRPETPADRIEIRTCAQAQPSLGFTYTGQPGYLSIFIMSEIEGAACAATSGTIRAFVPPIALPECSDGMDNDGDGAIDWPLDADCEDPSDTTERPPPPPVRVH